MQEVTTIDVHRSEVLLVADAMTGQEAVRVADDFNKAVSLTGLILTKMDGDARGGASVIDLPITMACQSSSWAWVRKRMHWSPFIQIAWPPVYWEWVMYFPD